MNNSIVHRGPDDGQVWANVNHTIALGHRRLSIIDLSARSRQPMVSASEKWIIVFNGEIYNYRELKAETNYPYKTTSDTEVILAYVEQYGMDLFLQKCNGMFAIALYNICEDKIYLCRDRLGIKPLYYCVNSTQITFSSEIKGILNSGLIEVEFNQSAVDEYLGNRYVREPYTFFKNILQLPSGHYMEISCNTMSHRVIKYWDIPSEFNTLTVYNENAIYSEFKYQVTEAIKRRMVSDVPLGAYLSGGVDSSIISAICAKNKDSRVNTYTIGFPELNEFAYARMVAERYKTIHHEIIMDNSDYFEKLQELILYKDAPLGIPNEVPLAVMSKELKKDITVVLSGEGADELMGGYGRIFRTPFDFMNINQNIDNGFYKYFINKYEYVPRKIRDKYITAGHPLREEIDEQIQQEFKKHSNEENVFRFFHKYHVKGLLQRVDITTMYASVEARVPFMDHELIEFAYKEIPYDLKLKWNSAKDMQRAMNMCADDYSERLDCPKYLLRRMGLELLPDEIVNRRKVGFPVPLDEWYNDLVGMARIILKDANWFEYDRLEELVCDCKMNVRSGQLLWMFVNIELFRKMYFSRDWAY